MVPGVSRDALQQGIVRRVNAHPCGNAFSYPEIPLPHIMAAPQSITP